FITMARSAGPASLETAPVTPSSISTPSPVKSKRIRLPAITAPFAANLLVTSSSVTRPSLSAAALCGEAGGRSIAARKRRHPKATAPAEAVAVSGAVDRALHRILRLALGGLEIALGFLCIAFRANVGPIPFV